MTIARYRIVVAEHICKECADAFIKERLNNLFYTVDAQEVANYYDTKCVWCGKKGD